MIHLPMKTYLTKIHKYLLNVVYVDLCVKIVQLKDIKCLEFFTSLKYYCIGHFNQ